VDIFALFMLAAGLSMDACAVAVCKGLALGKLSVKHMVVTALWFGVFQAAMPVAGYMFGVQFRDGIMGIAHWMSFLLLELIGISMIKEACRKDGMKFGSSLAVREMLPLALATSIDALAAGVAFAFLAVDIWAAAACIGTVTFLLSMAGVKAGNIFGMKYKAGAELAGGGILVLLGIKILLEHVV